VLCFDILPHYLALYWVRNGLVDLGQQSGIYCLESPIYTYIHARFELPWTDPNHPHVHIHTPFESHICTKTSHSNPLYPIQIIYVYIPTTIRITLSVRFKYPIYAYPWLVQIALTYMLIHHSNDPYLIFFKLHISVSIIIEWI